MLRFLQQTRGGLVASAFSVLTAVACGPRPVRLPEGPGEPFPGAQVTLDQVTKTCRGVRTMTAELALSGRSARTKLRGRVLVGMAAPALLRLEGVAPFGPPAFILAARRDEAVLLLPRDARVVRGATGADILDALAGVPLGPDELRAILTGCVTALPSTTGGTRYGRDAASIALEGGATLYVTFAGGTARLSGARVGKLVVEYSEVAAGLPRRVRLQLAAPAGGPVGTDLTMILSQIEINTTIDPAAFTIDVPADALPLTIEELREAGPLGTRGGYRDSGRSQQPVTEVWLHSTALHVLHRTAEAVRANRRDYHRRRAFEESRDVKTCCTREHPVPTPQFTRVAHPPASVAQPARVRSAALQGGSCGRLQTKGLRYCHSSELWG